MSSPQLVYLADEKPEAVVPQRYLMFSGFPDMLQVKHLTIILDQSEKTVRGLISRGELPALRIDERLYVPKGKLIEYIDGGGA